MILLNITLDNFCQFAGRKDFDFKSTDNKIEADNNCGKSTIGHAIAYLLQGRDMDGSDKVDSLINDKQVGKRYMTVNGAITDNDGQVFTIERSREISAANKTKNTLIVNGEIWTQAKLDMALGITDYRLFMASMFPTWIHAVDDKVAADVLRSLIKPVSSKIVIKSLPTVQGEILAKIPTIKLADPSGYQSELRKEIKANETETTKAKGRLEVYTKTASQELAQEFYKPIEEMEAEKAKLTAELNATASNVPTDTESIKRVIERLRVDYTQAKNSIRAIPPEPAFDGNAICDKCGQKLSREAFEKSLESHKAHVFELEKWNKQTKERIKGIVISATAAKEELAKAEEQNALIESCESFKRSKELDAKIRELEGELYQAKDYQRRRELMQMQIDEAVKSKDKDLKLIADMEAEIPAWKAEIDALGAYLVERERLTMEQIRQHLDKTDINLFTLVKSTGELKPDFAITYDGQTYKNMSSSNRIRCGLEISELVNAVTGWQLPVYIDNAESITDFKIPARQYFMAAVVKGAALTVNQ